MLRLNLSALFIFSICLSFAVKPETSVNINTAVNANYLSSLEKEIIYEINLFRSNPAEYAENFIAPLAKNYQKRILNYPGDQPILTKEGVNALYECVRVLKNATPKPILYPDRSLTNSAEDHQKDQSRTGRTGHVGSDNSNLKIRIEKYGNWKVRIAENIAYGNTSARQVVIFLLIDDDVKNRGHRNNLLNPDFKVIGVSCGSHPVYNTMCVMDFAGGVTGKQISKK